MEYANKKVLALPFGEYFDVFEKIFIEGKNKWNWNIRAVDTSNYFKPYKKFLDSADQLYVVPNFSKKQDWESDLSQQKEIQELMKAAEKVVGVPLNRILLSCERSLGRAYSRSDYYWPESNIARRILKNNSVSNEILGRAFKFTLDVFQDFKPDFCLGAPPCEITNSIFYFVAKQLGIPFVSSMFSIALPDRHFWTQEWGSFNSEIKKKFQKKEEEFYQPSVESLEHIMKFRREPEPLPYYKKNWADKNNKITFFNVNRNVVKNLIYRLVPIIKGEKVPNPKPFFQIMVDAYRSYFLKIFQKKRYASFTDNELSKFDYVYYPMHQDPEFVLNIQASAWYDQLNTIKTLSFNLPAGCKLLVREHRNNVGRRSNSFLKTISQFPGVVLVDPYSDQYKYIKNANLIVTVNGSTGLEGILLKKNVMTLDRTPYDALNFSFKLHNASELGTLLLDAFNNDRFQEDYDKKLALFLDAEKETTFRVDEDPEIEMNKIQEIINQNNNIKNINIKTEV